MIRITIDYDGTETEEYESEGFVLGTLSKDEEISTEMVGEVRNLAMLGKMLDARITETILTCPEDELLMS